jgi:hypothetical protein
LPAAQSFDICAVFAGRPENDEAGALSCGAVAHRSVQGRSAGEHLATADGKLNPNVPVSSKTPPTFLVQAEDDYVDGVKQSLVY